MLINLIREAKNGQLEFDYASLEALTSKESVEDLKNFVGNGTITKCEVEELAKGRLINIQILVEYDGPYSKQKIIYKWEYSRQTNAFNLEFGLGVETMRALIDWAG